MLPNLDLLSTQLQQLQLRMLAHKWAKCSLHLLSLFLIDLTRNHIFSCVTIVVLTAVALGIQRHVAGPKSADVSEEHMTIFNFEN
jgi:hypothetical protein